MSTFHYYSIWFTVKAYATIFLGQANTHSTYVSVLVLIAFLPGGPDLKVLAHEPFLTSTCSYSPLILGVISLSLINYTTFVENTDTGFRETCFWIGFVLFHLRICSVFLKFKEIIIVFERRLLFML